MAGRPVLAFADESNVPAHCVPLDVKGAIPSIETDETRTEEVVFRADAHDVLNELPTTSEILDDG